MDEHYKKHIARIKKIGESTKRRTEIYSGLASLDDRGTARSLGSLQRASAPGKKLQKIGFIFLFSPDPLTTPFGIPMIIAGKYLEKIYNGATIKDVGQETKNFFSDYSHLKNKMG
ncbi:MAG TPA: hypothetical protein VFG24_02670 [Nitrosopumilaceae archaeon]|nr:hypothetical protein [Nitrosopumilaceae archaeon]